MVPGSPTFHPSTSTCFVLVTLDLAHVSPRFCSFIRKDPNEEYQHLSILILYNFLEWALNLRRGKKWEKATRHQMQKLSGQRSGKYFDKSTKGPLQTRSETR